MSIYQAPDDSASASKPSLSRIGYLVKRVQAALRASLDEAYRPLGIGVSQYAILEALVEMSDVEATNAAIARRCFVTPQSANEMLTTMTEARLVSRRPKNRSRQIPFYLTKRGRDMSAEARRLSHEVEERMLSGLTEEDRQNLASLLVRCARSLES